MKTLLRSYIVLVALATLVSYRHHNSLSIFECMFNVVVTSGLIIGSALTYFAPLTYPMLAILLYNRYDNTPKPTITIKPTKTYKHTYYTSNDHYARTHGFRDWRHMCHHMKDITP